MMSGEPPRSRPFQGLPDSVIETRGISFRPRTRSRLRLVRFTRSSSGPLSPISSKKMYFPSLDTLGYCNHFPVVSSDHFPAVKSKTSSLCRSTVKADRIRPSEDKRGAHMPMLSGKVESCLLRRSTFCMLYLLGSPPPNCPYWAKNSELPSGDH